MSKKNILRYIILGLLDKKELTGYDITKIFEQEIGEFWKAKHSQIYPELKKLEEDQFISYKMETVGSKLEKKCYTIREEGKRELEEWISEPTRELLANKDEFILKLYFIREEKDERINKMFEEQILMHEEKLEHLRLRKQIVFKTNQEKELNYGHYLILDHAINREEGYLLWLKEQQNNLQKS
ncbi:PadR family transcriptional regulator [Anaeromicropila herbilytica]|uniref:Transcriptional regulator n=1 Tax=Anaeromicropila herbilytica TaxID=2785025 RepID=A0A7R7EJR4_9FIRM|nr:PadR family transcriptional regulator [Anaeromicropila herbilytica]BCN30058.1 transcriptional regulator [Anaeromicropila herbilytica]